VRRARSAAVAALLAAASIAIAHVHGVVRGVGVPVIELVRRAAADVGATEVRIDPTLARRRVLKHWITAGAIVVVDQPLTLLGHRMAIARFW
jgi:hypothetical protein